MLKRSADNNARLLKVDPTGFSLDAEHTPHITMLQCFARTADLDKLYPAAGKVIASANVTAMKLVAFKYYYAPVARLASRASARSRRRKSSSCRRTSLPP